MIDRLCIIGVGLIGGSLARAARRAGACREIVGGGRDGAQLARAVELGVIDRYTTDLAQAVAAADMVVLAVPLGAMESVMRAVAESLRPDAIVTDVGSAKGSVVAAAEREFGAMPRRFVPGHPIAGTEQSGVEASFADLFAQRRVILTPLPITEREAVNSVRRLWQQAGAEVVEMSVAHHDEVLAATSHLPHMLAYALVDTLARMQEKAEIFRYAAGGFHDFTRIASSDPAIWRDICLANRAPLVAVLDRYQHDLTALRDAIAAADGERILHVFSRAKKARDQYSGQNSVKSRVKAKTDH